MAELLILDGLYLNGYPNDSEGFDVASSVSPYQVADKFDARPGDRKYEWAESSFSIGASQIGEASQSMMERTVPLWIRNRFSSAYTNLLTNPRPHSVVTGWQAEGTGSTVTFNTVESDDVIQAVTTGSANSGMESSFTATVASYSFGAWVKVSTGTAACKILFDGETGTAFTATTDWQFVKTEGVTLTAATRYPQVVQTDTGSRTIYVKMAGVVLSSTYPGYIDGACGDCIWNGTAHASTSTSKTGEDAILKAFGLLGEKTEKAVYKSPDGGLTLIWQAAGASYRSTIDCRAVDVTKLEYDHPHAVADGSGRRIALTEATLVCHPHVKGPEYTAATIYKAAGTPALQATITDVKGHVKGPARVVFTAGTQYDQRFAIYGIQGRDYVSGSSLVLRGPDMGTTGYSGSIVAHVNEVQTISQTGTITAGSYALSLDAVSATASPIVYTSGTSALDTYIETIPNIGSGGVTVSAGPLPGTAGTITFGGTLAGCNVSPLVVDNSGLTGGSYVITTNTAGVPGYVTASLYSTETTICDTGNLSLIGSYSVWARVYDNAATTDLYKSRVRLKWTVGDGGYDTNDWAIPQAVGDYSLVDLGQVHIGTAPTGTQRFKGLVEAKTSGTAGNTLRIVDLYFVPMENGIGDVRAVETSDRTLTLFDNFSAISGGMNGDSATLGGAWAGAGDANDFQGGSSSVTRADPSDTSTDIRSGRLSVLATTFTDVAAEVGVAVSFVALSSPQQGLVLRYTDTSNFVAMTWTRATTTATYARVYKVVAATVTTLGYAELGATQTSATLAALIRDSGYYEFAVDGSVVLSGSDSVLATGGALASGKTGIVDWNISLLTPTRTYTNFYAWTPADALPAIYQSQDLQFRQNEILREASAGSVYGVPFQNSQPFQPMLTPEGSEGLSNRVLLRTGRFNPDEASDPNPDAFTAQILHTPVYLLGRDES